MIKMKKVSSVIVILWLLALISPCYPFDNTYLIEDARRGDMEAQYTLGHLYLKGRGGFERNFGSGVEWMRKAAEAGHEDAPFDLAMALLDAGDSKSREKAFYWLKKAAEMDHVEAQYVLGLAYQYVDPEKGLYWLTLSAQNGHEEAAKRIDAWCRSKIVSCD